MDALKLVEQALPYMQNNERCWAHRWRRDARLLIDETYGRHLNTEDTECPHCGGDSAAETTCPFSSGD